MYNKMSALLVYPENGRGCGRERSKMGWFWFSGGEGKGGGLMSQTGKIKVWDIREKWSGLSG